MPQFILSFLASVVGRIVSYCVCRLLDRLRKVDKK